MSKKFIISLIVATMALFALVRSYGGTNSLNAGISIGISDTCQMGYEWRGDIGFFAYC